MNDGRVIGDDRARSPTLAGPRPSSPITRRRVGSESAVRWSRRTLCHMAKYTDLVGAPPTATGSAGGSEAVRRGRRRSSASTGKRRAWGEALLERERSRRRSSRSVERSRQGLGHRGDRSSGVHHSANRTCRIARTLAPPTHETDVRRSVDVVSQRLDRLPDRQVDGEQLVLVHRADRGGIAVLRLEPPDETRRRVGERVDPVEVGDEVGDQRVIDTRPQSPDVDLREMPLHAPIVPLIAPCSRRRTSPTWPADEKGRRWESVAV